MGRNNRDQTERMQIYFLATFSLPSRRGIFKSLLRKQRGSGNDNRDSHYLRPVSKVTKEHLQARNTKRRVGSSWSER